MPDPQDLVNQLRTTLGKMELAFSVVSEPILWTDREGRVQWCNQAFATLMNRENIELIGARVAELLPLTQEGHPLPPERHPVSLLLQGQPQLAESYEFDQDGRRMVLEVSGARAELKGSEVSTVLVLRDITQRREAEQALQASNEDLQQKIANIKWLRQIMLEREARIHQLEGEMRKPPQ